MKFEQYRTQIFMAHGLIQLLFLLSFFLLLECKLSFVDHVDFVMTVCSQRVSLFVEIIAKSGSSTTAVAHSLCGFNRPVWDHMHSQPGEGGLPEQERLDAFLKRPGKFGYCNEHYAIAELFDKADAKLFKHVQRLEHCLHHLSPDNS